MKLSSSLMAQLATAHEEMETKQKQLSQSNIWYLEANRKVQDHQDEKAKKSSQLAPKRKAFESALKECDENTAKVARLRTALFTKTIEHQKEMSQMKKTTGKISGEKDGLRAEVAI